MSTHHNTLPTPSCAPVHCGFQNAVVTRIDAALESLEALSSIAEQLRHADLQKLADDAFNALQDASIRGQSYTGPSFVCEKCKAGIRGDSRYYPGSALANQPRMERICRTCEQILNGLESKALAAAPMCKDCGVRKATLPETGQCWPCMEAAKRIPATPTAPPAPVITAHTYQASARAEKAQTMAKILFRGGVASVDVAQMTAGDWSEFHAGLKAKGILRPNSTTPSDETVALTILEVRKLERAAQPRKVAGAKPSGYAMIAPGIAVATRRRSA